MKGKIVSGSWAGQVGEFVAYDEAAGTLIFRMPGARLVEFKPVEVEHFEDSESEVAEPHAASSPPPTGDEHAE